MNNLKRVLSLALSGVMLVGMMAVGASAADFVDADKIQHGDAVGTLVALNVINGKDDGSHFDPEGDVTRAEMAKMIAVAMNGGTDTNTGVKGTASFTDIKGHWAESYIEYCHDLGIISGRGDGTFDPNGNVTGLEATKMVLTALGYDSAAYLLTGASWAVRTDELARSADPSIYEELAGVVMANKATRDTAAQLIWNGLQNQTRRVNPDKNTNTGEVTWNYGEGDIMLYERYGARVYTGTYAANHNTDDTVDDGCIKLENGKTTVFSKSNGIYQNAAQDVKVTSDLSIENIGEEVKVVFKDVLGGTVNYPDKKDVIYGVFNTGKTEVYNVTKNDLQSTDAKKVKFGGSTYNMVDGGVKVVTNYITDVHPVSAAANAGLKDQSADTIKFVCDDEGKIAKAYVVEMNVAKVTATTASKITLSAEGAIDISDNDVADGLAKDDVVVYTKYYSAKKDDAFYTVKKAEAVEGQMTGFKFDNSKYQNVVVDGTSYKFHEPQGAGLLPAVTDDAVADLFDLNNRSGASIGDQIRVYMVGGMAYAVESIEQSGGNYAVITEVGDTGTIGNNMNGLKVNVMLADGTEQILTVHKDSTNITNRGTNTEASAKITASATNHTAQAALLCDGMVGRLIEYTSISEGTIKIKDVIEEPTTAVTTTNLWDENTKKMSFYDGSQQTSAVAASNAILFVGLDQADVSSNTSDGNGGMKKMGNGTVDKWYVYDLRALGTFVNTYAQGTAGSSWTDSKVKVSYITNSSGLVTAAYMTLNSRPGSTTADTLYGIVTGFTGSRQNAAGDDLFRYTVAVGRDSDVEINVVNDRSLRAGMLVRFDETGNGEYEINENLIKLVPTTDTVESGLITSLDGAGAYLALAAVRDYRENANLLTYYSSTTYDVATKTYIGTEQSATVDKDVKFFYVNGDDNEQGAETGVMPYDTSTGYANALLHFNNKGIVDVIIVETSGEVNLASTTSTDVATGVFGDNKAPLDASVNAADIKVLDDGIYTAPNGVPSGVATSATATDLMYFKFTAAKWNKPGTDADGNAITTPTDQKYTLTISDGSTDVYTEQSGVIADTLGHFFFVDLSGDHIVSGATGSLASGTKLVQGNTYSYKIVGEDGNTYLNGSFVAADYTA